MTLRARPPQECPCVAGCGKLWRARSRLYQSQILQVNMRLKALAEIYTIRSFAQRLESIIAQQPQLCNLKFSLKFKFDFCQNVH